MTFFAKIVILVMSLLLMSCQTIDREQVDNQHYSTKKYKLAVDKIELSDKTEHDNLININISNKFRGLCNERKFIASGGEGSFKIIIVSAKIKDETSSDDNITYSLDMTIKIEAYTEKDLLFPIVESNYNISESKSLKANASFNRKIKLFDKLIDEALLKLDIEIDKNFEQYFSRFITLN